MPPWQMNRGARSANFAQAKQSKQRSPVTSTGASWQNSSDTSPLVPRWTHFAAVESPE